jgi:hypothetical protein
LNEVDTICAVSNAEMKTTLMGEETGERAWRVDRDEKYFLIGDWWEHIITHLSIEEQFRTWVCDNVGLAVRAS